MKKYTKKIMVGVLALLVLAAAWFWGDNQPDEVLVAIPTEQTTAPTQVPQEETLIEPQGKETEVPTNIPAPERPTEPEESEPVPICTLSVRCDEILQNMDQLAEGKETVVPPNGILYPEQSVEFFPGESVFDVFCRELRKHNIHFEYVKTPMYNSVYIEGIGNLYEFDCGEYSGWMFRVNGERPTYGCSQYQVERGDRIEFYYSCSW